MSPSKIIKVCKIDSLVFASFIMKQNIDFLGIHILQKDQIGDHKELIDYITIKRGKVIIVTKINDIETLQELVEFYHPAGLQFHFEIEISIVVALKELFPTLLLFGVFTNNSINKDFYLINKVFDYLIYDNSFVGGTGKKTIYKYFDEFPQSLKEKTLLAGGITGERLVALNSLCVCGYDIQSYLRTNYGPSFRNLEEICDFIKAPRKKMLSISLTDMPLSNMNRVLAYHLNPNLEYHLDLSNGSVYSSFNTTNRSIKEKQQLLSQFPHSVHLFFRQEDEIKEYIDKLSQTFPLSLIRIFVQYFTGIDKNIFKKRKNGLKVVPSVFYKDLNSYFSQPVDSMFLSVIVPDPNDKDEIESFINIFLLHRKDFEGKEIWIDRNLGLAYIKVLTKRLGRDFNFIIGKEVIKNWNQMNVIYEYLLKQK
jgi:phosphoribosylanthranilate isomerase